MKQVLVSEELLMQVINTSFSPYGTQDLGKLVPTLMDVAKQSDVCERICAAIKTADDKSVDESGYMLDSDDCIEIVREQFTAPQAQPAQVQETESLTH